MEEMSSTRLAITPLIDKTRYGCGVIGAGYPCEITSDAVEFINSIATETYTTGTGRVDYTISHPASIYNDVVSEGRCLTQAVLDYIFNHVLIQGIDYEMNFEELMKGEP